MQQAEEVTDPPSVVPTKELRAQRGPGETGPSTTPVKRRLPLNLLLNPNPPMDTDGRREDTGRRVRKLQKRWSGLEFG